MRITFLGAAHEVTGSCYYLEAAGKRFLVDCGLKQGPNYFETAELPVAPSDLDFVLLTHAHIDHSGKLPLLYAQGFRGSIYTTYATADLCDIMLRDSAHIQMSEAEWKNRKGKRAGREEIQPLYNMDDAQGTIGLLVGCPYKQILTVADGIQIRFIDAGHLLGSASIEVWLSEDGQEKKIVFSGDIGNLNQPLIKDPTYLRNADYVVMESTYGNRKHEVPEDYESALAQVIQRTFDRGGNVVIPSFAVGRTQEMLYFLREIKSKGLIHGHGGFKVYVDSPLAVQATTVFNKNMYECFDEETLALVKAGVNPISFPGLRLSITSDESKAINFDEEPKVILSASGMCEAGRIRHHLKHNLWRPECTILFVGYQAVGTLGRTLVEGAKEVKLFGEPVEVRAHVETLAGISGHADKQGLIRWLEGLRGRPRRVFIVHGEDQVCDSFAECLRNEYGYSTAAPYTGESWDLASNVRIAEGSRERIQKKARARQASTVYDRLVECGRRLMSLIERSKGLANKDLAKFADQIQALCDKWEK